MKSDIQAGESVWDNKIDISKMFFDINSMSKKRSDTVMARKSSKLGDSEVTEIKAVYPADFVPLKDFFKLNFDTKIV